MARRPPQRSVEENLTDALERAEDALAAVTRIAIEQIRAGSETSQHVEAAERDMRSALRQLVLAERDVHARPIPRSSHGEQPEATTDRRPPIKHLA